MLNCDPVILPLMIPAELCHKEFGLGTLFSIFPIFMGAVQKAATIWESFLSRQMLRKGKQPIYHHVTLAEFLRQAHAITARSNCLQTAGFASGRIFYCTRWPRKKTSVGVFMQEMKDGKGQVKYQEVANTSVPLLQWVTYLGGKCGLPLLVSSWEMA